MATYLPNITDVFPEPSLFTPDFSFMDKMLQRREALYQQGFSEINSRYNWINRETTNAANTAAKENFIKQARENLRDLSAMDLSQPQNVDAANHVFEPFVKNTNIIGDQTVTEHWKQQVEIGNGFRLRDGGKEFSQTNIDYINQQRAAYAQDDPSSWGNYYSSRRYYTPYYDYMKEYKEAMKEFKPDSVDITTAKGFYFMKEKDASVRPAAVKRYLEATLSDKAKQQMRIEAAVSLGNDKNALVGQYQTSANSQIKTLDKEIGLVNTRMKIEKDPNVRKQMSEYVSYLEDAKDGYKRDITNIQKGNLAPVLAKAEDIAYDMYSNNVINKVANGYARKDIVKDITVNSAAVSVYVQDRMDARQEDAQKHAEKMKMLELTGGLGGGLVNLPTAMITGEDDAKVTTSLKDVENRILDAGRQRQAMSANLSKSIINYYKNDGQVTKEDQLTEADLIRDPSIVDKFVKENGHLDVVSNYIKGINQIEAQMQVDRSYIQQARENVNSKLTPQEKQALKGFEQKVAPVGTITFRDGQKFSNYSPQDIYNGLINGTVTYKKQGGVGYLNVQGKQYLIGPNNNDPYLMKAFGKISQIKDMIDDDKVVSGTVRKFNKEMANIFTGDPTSQATMAKVLDPESKYGKAIASRIKGLLPTSVGTIGIEGVQQSVRNGRTYFTVTAGSDKAQLRSGSNNVAVSDDEALKILQVKFTNTGVKVGKWAGGLYIDDPNLIAQGMGSNLTQTEKLLIDGDKYAKDGYESPYWYPLDRAVNKGAKLPVFKYQKSLDYNNKPQYYLFDGDGGGFIGGKVYNDLYDLMTDAKSLSLDPQALKVLKP